MAYATLRVFRVTFYCEECPNEFTDEMLTVSHSWCPCCDMRCEPDGIEEYEVETCEDDDDPELTDLHVTDVVA